MIKNSHHKQLNVLSDIIHFVINVINDVFFTIY